MKPEGDECADCNISGDALVSGEQEMMNKSHEEVDAGQNTVKLNNLMGAKDMDDGQTSKETDTCSSQSSTLSYKELKNTQKDHSLEEDSETPTEEYTLGEENEGGTNDEMGGEDDVDN